MLLESSTTAAVELLGGLLLDARSVATEIAEPMTESAPIAFDWAMQHCAQGSKCQAYHAVWQYLRLADLRRSVRADGAVYIAVIERLARAGRLRRVLITASADYSMLAHLAHGASRGGAEPEFHIVDRCTTALQLNEWYAGRLGLNVRTIRSHVLDYDSGEPYDLICAHSFIQWLPLADRPHLFECWRKHLAPEGHICFSNRVWSERLAYEPLEMGRRVDRLAAKALDRLSRLGIRLPCDEDQFLELLRRYGYRRDENLPLPMDDLRRWIENAGLKIEIAVPSAHIVPKFEEPDVGPFPNSRGPRMWFQLCRA